MFEQVNETPAQTAVGGGTDTTGEYATFQLRVAGVQNARTVLPQYDVTTLRYRFSYLDAQANLTQYPQTGTCSYSDLVAQTFTLLTGEYLFALDAYTNESEPKKLFFFSDFKTITADMTTLSFTLAASTDTGSATTGTASITVTFPATAGVTGVTAKLVALSDLASGTAADEQDVTAAVTTADDTSSVTYTATDIAAGIYMVYILLTATINGDTFTTVIPELVTIAAGVTSSNAQSPIALTDVTANTRYAISYKNADGTDFTDWAGTVTVPFSFVQGQTVTLPVASDVAKTGLTFVGWYEDADDFDDQSKKVRQFTGGTEEKTFYAKWLASGSGSSSATTLSSANYTDAASLATAIKDATGDVNVVVATTLSETDLGKIANVLMSTQATVTLDLSGTTMTTVAASSFANCSKLVKIILPQTLTSIGNSAFQNCPALTEVVIPQNVTAIGEKAFVNCTNLSSVQFETTTGWKCATTTIDVTAPATNASNLKTSGHLWCEQELQR